MGKREFKGVVLMMLCLWVCGVTASVTYDHKAIVVDGKRRILISGSIHYPRSTPQVLTPLHIWYFHYGCIKFFFNHFLHLFSFFFFTLSCMHHESCLLMQMWPDLIQKAKDGGLDVIQTYVFWNGHEPSPGQVMQTHFLNFIFIFL